MGEDKGTPISGMDTMTRGVLGLLALGIILIVIGFDANSSGTADAGVIFASLALFGGGLLLKLDGYARLGMLIAGGFVLASVAPAILGFGW
jgi:hypothetical protein